MYEIIQRSSDWEKRERRTELAFAEPDMLGDTPIRKAAENGYVDCVKFIVSCVPTAVLDLKRKTKEGVTIAHIAAIRGHVEILEYLAELDPYLLESKTKDKITPLDYAILCGKIDAATYIARTAPSGIKLFLKKNIDGEIALKKTKWEEIRAYFTRKKIQEIGLDRERILSGSDLSLLFLVSSCKIPSFLCIAYNKISMWYRYYEIFFPRNEYYYRHRTI